MGTVYIYIQSYDCINHIRNILNDVLNQTYRDWVCIVYDNASSDGTWDVVKSYAANDERFVVKKFSKQTGLMMKKVIPHIFLVANEKDYFVRIDADDRIEIDYLERMVAFQEMSNAELVCCSYDCINAESQRIEGNVTLDKDVVLTDDDFTTKILQYYKFTYTHWAKLYTLPLLKKMRIQRALEISRGVDTLLAQEAFLQSSTVGIMKDCLYHYYLYNSIIKFDLFENRAAILADRWMEFILLKAGELSKDNLNMVCGLYESELHFHMKKVMISDLSDEEKIDIYYRLFKTHYSRMLLEHAGRSDWMYEIAGYCVDLYKRADEVHKELLAEIFAILGLCPTKVEGMVKGEIFALYMSMHRHWAEKKGENSLIEYGQLLVEDEPLLKGIDARVLFVFPDITLCILDKDYAGALKLLLEEMKDMKLYSWEYKKIVAMLARNLSAIQGDEANYVQMTKRIIEHCIEMERFEDAMEELDDWDIVLPDDTDFARFRSEIEAAYK